MTELVIVGAGGFARETAAAAAAAGRRIAGFVDDDPALHGTARSGLPILGGVESAKDMWDAELVVCVGNPRDYGVRQRLVDRLGLPEQHFGVVLHPSAELGAGCVVAPGSVVLAGAVLTADAYVGAHVAIMPQVVLTHDCRVADYATLATGVRLGGGVVVERGAYLGAGAMIREGVRIGAGSLVGMGSVVLRDVPPGEIWAGNPARFLRTTQEPS